MRGATITIREARDEDRIAVGEIFALTFPDDLNVMFGKDPARQARILADLPQADRTYVAEVERRVAGALTLYLGEHPESSASLWRALRRHCGLLRSLSALSLLRFYDTSTADRRTAYVDTLGVHPSYRRRGIGERLLRRALAEARAVGKQEIGLHCLRSNERALHLYRRVGFTPQRVERMPWMWPFFGIQIWLYMSKPLVDG